jgi:hypothetical protein
MDHEEALARLPALEAQADDYEAQLDSRRIGELEEECTALWIEHIRLVRLGLEKEAELHGIRTGRPPRKPPSELLTECAVRTTVCSGTPSHNHQADKIGIHRTVYYDLKAGRRVSEATYTKVALYLTEHGVPCTARDLKP